MKLNSQVVYKFRYYDAMKDFVETLARATGEILRKASRQPEDVRLKSPRNLVTAADLAAEKFIRAEIESKYPDHAIVGEEMPKRPGADVTWHIDPIDGTTNFAHGIPHWCVSIGAEDRLGLLIGAVYDPLRDELFFAERGLGATLNGTPIRVSPEKSLENILAATGFASMRGEKQDADCLAIFLRVIDTVQGIRRMGSAALDLAYVACGRVDIFFEEGLSSWDITAGMLLVKEAGGATDVYERGGIVAANPSTLKKFRHAFL